MTEFNVLKFIAYNAGLNTFQTMEKAFQEGKLAEQKKIMDMIDDADDGYEAMATVSKYLIEEAMKR